MTQITARVSEELAAALSAAAAQVGISRADVIRRALKSYLEDLEDATVAAARLRDDSDPVLDWDEVKRELLGSAGPRQS